MKRNIAIITFILILIFFIGCNIGSTGTYYNTEDDRQFIELMKDGEIYFYDGRRGYMGTYRIDGEVMTVYSGLGYASRATIRGNTIYDDEGGVWVKR